MIYARVDVELRDHPRAAEAGAAMATWLWLLLYTRRHELDGFIPSVALRGAWVGEEQARRDVDRLIEVGLCTRAEGGVSVVGYSAKNETRDRIEQRRAAEAEKKARWRESRRASTGVSTAPSTDVSPVDTSPLSALSPEREKSQSQSHSHSQSQGHTGSGTGLSPVDISSVPEWFGGAIETVESQTGEKLEKGNAWLRYAGHRSAKDKPMSHGDAVYWLTTVAVRDAKAERERRRQAPKQAASAEDVAEWRRAQG